MEKTDKRYLFIGICYIVVSVSFITGYIINDLSHEKSGFYMDCDPHGSYDTNRSYCHGSLILDTYNITLHVTTNADSIRYIE